MAASCSGSLWGSVDCLASEKEICDVSWKASKIAKLCMGTMNQNEDEDEKEEEDDSKLVSWRGYASFRAISRPMSQKFHGQYNHSFHHCLAPNSGKSHNAKSK